MEKEEEDVVFVQRSHLCTPVLGVVHGCLWLFYVLLSMGGWVGGWVFL